MDRSKILDALSDMAGLSKEEVLKHSPLVTLAIAQVEAQCKSDVEPDKEPSLIMLCAALVNLWVNLASSSKEPSGSFSGNGYSISKDSQKQSEMAQGLFDRWRMETARLLVDEGFAFFSSREAFNERT